MWSSPLIALSLLLSATAHSGDKSLTSGPWCASLAADHRLACPSDGMGSRTTYFVCSSEAGAGRVECWVPTPQFRVVASLALETVHGKGRCAEGDTYGTKGDMVWVTGGCTATFAATIGVDEERCATARQKLIAQGCEGALEDIATCQADITAFCSDLKLPSSVLKGTVLPPPFGWDHSIGRHHGMRPWGGPDGDEAEREGEEDGDEGRPSGRLGEPHGRWPRRHRDPHHGAHGHRHGCAGRLLTAFGPPPMSPAASLLGQCLREHLEQLGPECRQTAALQALTNPPPTIEDAIFWVMLATAASGAMAVCLGFVYFFWQRARLQARRGVVAEKYGSWSTGLFTLDLRSLLPSCLCPWFQSALNQAETHGRDSSLADVALNVSSHSLVSNTYLARQALREKYDMPAEPFMDCLASALCLPCAMAQVARELEVRNSQQVLPADVVVGQPVAPKEGYQHVMV